MGSEAIIISENNWFAKWTLQQWFQLFEWRVAVDLDARFYNSPTFLLENGLLLVKKGFAYAYLGRGVDRIGSSHAGVATWLVVTEHQLSIERKRRLINRLSQTI